MDLTSLYKINLENYTPLYIMDSVSAPFIQGSKSFPTYSRNYSVYVNPKYYIVNNSSLHINDHYNYKKYHLVKYISE